MLSRLCLLLVIHTGLLVPALCLAQADTGGGKGQLIPRKTPHGRPCCDWPSLQEVHAPFADILVTPSAGAPGTEQALAEKPAQAQDQAHAIALEKVRQAEALRPSFHLPRPVLLPQVVRFINAELATQKVPWTLALALAASAPPAHGAAAAAQKVVVMDGGVPFTVHVPPPAEQLLVSWHEGLLEYALPEPPAFVHALEEGTLGGLILALAQVLPATVTFEPAAAGGGRVVLTPWLPEGRPPLGQRLPLEELQRLYADVLYTTPGQLKKSVNPTSFHHRARELQAVLRTLKAVPVLPQPALRPQVLRLMNEALARQHAPYRVLYQPNPHPWEDAAEHYDDVLCHLWQVQDYAKEALSTGNPGDIIMLLGADWRWPEALSLLPEEGSLVVQGRFQEGCVEISPVLAQIMVGDISGRPDFRHQDRGRALRKRPAI